MRAHIEQTREAFLGRLSEWLRIPSVGADPAHDDDVRASAQWLAAELTAHGWPTVEIWETAGHPAVFAEWPAADTEAPTYLVYGHHDVQPVDPVELWDSAPFEPFVRSTDHGDELVGRGAIDDKGQVLYHLLGLQAHLQTSGRSAPGVHLKLLVEGEEESGSPHFVALLRERAERLRCDTVVVSDSGMWSRDVPRSAWGCAGWSRPRWPCTGRRATCTPGRSAEPYPTRSRSWWASWPACTTRTGGSPSTASTTGSASPTTRSAP